MKAKAWRLYGASDLRLEDVELPAAGADGVVVEIVANSVCVSDYKCVTLGAGHKRVPDGLPLVMHGGSGLTDEDYREVIARGIRKVNYYTYGALAGGRAVYDIVRQKPDGLQFHDVAVAATDAIADDIKRVMKVISAGRLHPPCRECHEAAVA